MKNSRFTESQIVSILKDADAGAKVKKIRRRHETGSLQFASNDVSCMERSMSIAGDSRTGRRLGFITIANTSFAKTKTDLGKN